MTLLTVEAIICSVVRTFAHGTMGRSIDPSWCGMCYRVCGMVHIKEPLLIIGNSSPCNGGSGFPLSMSHISDPLSYFSFLPVLHDWCNKGRGMCYPVCGMVHIKEPLLLFGKSSPYGGSGFPLSLSEWSFTIILCPTPYNRK